MNRTSPRNYFHPGTLPFWGTHIAALVTIALVGFSWRGLLWTGCVYLLGMFFVTGGYHRYFSHRSYKTSRVFQFILAWGAQMTCQKGALWWAGNHRHHHKRSDEDDDIHSPRHGFFWSQVGWILVRDFENTRWELIRDLARYPELRFLNRWHLLPAIALGALVLLLGGWEALVVGFNVRANASARNSANQKGVEIRYYSVIYDLVDDVKAAASGLLSAEVREKFIGYAEIKEVFKVSNVGKVAGCLVTEGVARRSAGVRLLRDNVVIHEGTLKTLKRFKDEVSEVQSGQECGMAFENYQDMRQGDVIECYRVEEIRRTL